MPLQQKEPSLPPHHQGVPSEQEQVQCCPLLAMRQTSHRNSIQEVDLSTSSLWMHGRVLTRE